MADKQLEEENRRRELMRAQRRYLKSDTGFAQMARNMSLPVGLPVEFLRLQADRFAGLPDRARYVQQAGVLDPETGKPNPEAVMLANEIAGYAMTGSMPAGAAESGVLRSGMGKVPKTAERVNLGSALEKLDAAQGIPPVAKKLKTGTVLDPNNPPVVFRGKEPRDWSMKDLYDYGVEKKTPTPLAPNAGDEAAFKAGLRHYKTNSGRDFTMPAGTAKDPLSYYESLYMKAQGLDPNDMPEALYRELHDRYIAATAPHPGGSTPAQTMNQLNFGLTSPNTALTQNEFTVARLMPKEGTDDISRLANAAPWKIEDARNFKSGTAKPGEPRRIRADIDRDIARRAGVHAQSEGGIGTRSTANMSYVADAAKLMEKDPKWFKFSGAAEGGASLEEQWANYVQRVASQTQGLSMKTGSLGTVFQDPMNAGTSAIDRHMARQFTTEMFPSMEDANAFRSAALKKWNKNHPDKPATSFETLPKTGSHGQDDALFGHLNKHLDPQFRLESGEINPNIPEVLQKTKWIVEPENVVTMSPGYSRAVEAVGKQAADAGQSNFQRQWYLWDPKRGRVETHSVMNPNLTYLDRMSLEQAAQARKVHKDAGYFSHRGGVKPVDNPMSLAVWNAGGAPVQGLLPIPQQPQPPQGEATGILDPEIMKRMWR